MSEPLAQAPSPEADDLMHVAYLVNQYPMVSHSFIRREILALERAGVRVQRIALRGWKGDLSDEGNRAERTRTQHVLRGGAITLLGGLVRMLASRPRLVLGALLQASRLARDSDRSWPYHLVYWLEACVVAEWIETAGARHLHAHFGTNSAEVGLLAAQLARIPFSFTVHGPEEFDSPHALHLAAKIRHASFVVAISSFGRSQLYRWVDHGQWSKVQVVHCGIDRSFRDGPAISAPEGRPRLVCVGRICEQKGQLLLLAAMRRVIDRGLSFELVLAGDGDMRVDVERLASALGLEAQIRITGWIGGAQVRDEILAARALVLPSFAEGLPVVIMEAMALRRPVISTYVAGIPELVQPGVTGWLVPPGDVDELATAIESCLRADAPAISAMGEAARARVLARHDIDVEAAKLEKLFAGAAVRRPAEVSP